MVTKSPYFRGVLDVVDGITFTGWPLDWHYHIEENEHGQIWLWVEFERQDTNTGKLGWGSGRRWLIEPDATDESILKTAFVATKAILDHEAHEGFMFQGHRIFDPHTELKELMRRAARGR